VRLVYLDRSRPAQDESSCPLTSRVVNPKAAFDPERMTLKVSVAEVEVLSVDMKAMRASEQRRAGEAGLGGRRVRKKTDQTESDKLFLVFRPFAIWAQVSRVACLVYRLHQPQDGTHA
jgi:hypothetical protein